MRTSDCLLNSKIIDDKIWQCKNQLGNEKCQLTVKNIIYKIFTVNDIFTDNKLAYENPTSIIKIDVADFFVDIFIGV